MSEFRSDGLMTTRWLPLTSAAVITLLGLEIAVRSLVKIGICRSMYEGFQGKFK
jgi:hypothetical protein